MRSCSDQDYRKDITETLTLRWSTAKDQPGLALVGALAFGEKEGQEDDYAVRSSERLAMDAYPTGCSTSWAVCVDTAPSGNQIPSSGDSDYVAAVRSAARQRKEQIVAIVLLNRHSWSFECNSVTLTAGRIEMSACRSAYRGTLGLMSGLFDMVHARSEARGDSLCCVNGIPSYYSKQGYEYGVNFGKGLISHFGDLPLRSEPLPLLFSPTSPARTTDDAQPIEVLIQTYSIRSAQPDDAPRLLELHESPRTTSDQWVAYMPEELSAYSKWLAGHRHGPFADPAQMHTLDLPMREPVSVLERRDAFGQSRIVAALVLLPSNNSRQIIASRVLFEPQADLAAVTRELVLQTVPAVLKFWRTVIQQTGQQDAEITGDLSSEPSSMLWYLPPSNAVARHLVGQGLATHVHQDSLLMREEWSIRIPSLPAFLNALQPALQTRLDRAKSILGAAYTMNIGIGCYRLRYIGAVISIKECKITQIRAQTWQPRHLDRGSEGFGSVGGINVLASYAALIALTMGYKSRLELMATFPDTQLAPTAVVLVDVLFPRCTPSYPAYL